MTVNHIYFAVFSVVNCNGNRVYKLVVSVAELEKQTEILIIDFHILSAALFTITDIDPAIASHRYTFRLIKVRNSPLQYPGIIIYLHTVGPCLDNIKIFILIQGNGHWPIYGNGAYSLIAWEIFGPEWVAAAEKINQQNSQW